MSTVFSQQFGAVITPESKQHVHHMIAYLCEGLDYTGHSSVGVSHICDEFPEDLDVCRTNLIIAGWAVGGTVSYHENK